MYPGLMAWTAYAYPIVEIVSLLGVDGFYINVVCLGLPPRNDLGTNKALEHSPDTDQPGPFLVLHGAELAAVKVLAEMLA